VTRSVTEPRIRIDVLVDAAEGRAELYDATFWSLRGTPKELPAVWLYDERGSRLFEEITRLPEYYPTGSEREILTAHWPRLQTSPAPARWSSSVREPRRRPGCSSTRWRLPARSSGSSPWT
jgi:hypothetical protein